MDRPYPGIHIDSYHALRFDVNGIGIEFTPVTRNALFPAATHLIPWFTIEMVVLNQVLARLELYTTRGAIFLTLDQGQQLRAMRNGLTCHVPFLVRIGDGLLPDYEAPVLRYIIDGRFWHRWDNILTSCRRFSACKGWRGKTSRDCTLLAAHLAIPEMTVSRFRRL